MPSKKSRKSSQKGSLGKKIQRLLKRRSKHSPRPVRGRRLPVRKILVRTGTRPPLRKDQLQKVVRKVQERELVAKGPVVAEPLTRLSTAPRVSLSKKQVLLCPGPVNLSSHVRQALAGPDVCHREPEFLELLQTIRAKLLHALHLDARYTAILMNGSGTCALESAILSSVDPGKKLLVINNGVYGSRIAQIARIHDIPFVELRSPLTERPEINRIAAALKRESKIQTVAMVHHETSTGLLNPVEAVGALAKKFRRRFLVDAISSLGAEKFDLHKSHVGICVGSTGKCLHGVVGGSFVLLSQAEIPRVLKLKPRSLYLDLGLQLKAQEAGDPLFTPAVPLWIAFHAALDELVKEGLKKRIARYHERSVLLRSGFKKMGLQPLLQDKLLSSSLTALWLPEEMTYASLHRALKRIGFVVYAGQNELKGKIFRIAHMGQLLQGDLKELLKALGRILGASRKK